ncbi:hypothetical protein HAX54_002634 [Datura stramonium]|uniref:Uncharacterized protein n=1 Tax=Datura stramonium TaxID=4076 RepID=A0ABS8WW15_DATST|nr:hypothetical protein [Datura stramonium]
MGIVLLSGSGHVVKPPDEVGVDWYTYIWRFPYQPQKELEEMKPVNELVKDHGYPVSTIGAVNSTALSLNNSVVGTSNSTTAFGKTLKKVNNKVSSSQGLKQELEDCCS